MKYLITLGCSWTWGAGAGYTTGMSDADFKRIVFDKSIADQLGFRSVLSNKFGYKNVNMSIWRSSNQKQFRLARNFFSSDSFKSMKQNADDIVILWGITSTGRNEMYSSRYKEYTNFLLSGERFFLPAEKDMSEFTFTHLYDHEHEVFELAQEMNHWNTFFSAQGLKNYWFDSFNHHDYTVNSPGLEKPGLAAWDASNYKNNVKIPNFAIDHESARDLMSQLAIRSGFTNSDGKYHTSEWVNDTNRIEHLVSAGLINPFSFHPTAKGHEEIASMFEHLMQQ